MSKQLNKSPAPDWAKALSSDAYFAQEQTCLGEVWNFLGFASDLPNENDWFRASLGGRSVFVQRFKTGLRAFENICPHRFNQLRCEDNGNSPIVCGFHHWRFDGNGDAVGIPKCKEMYNKTPVEMGASLTPVELSVCGDFIFGRFGSGTSLQDWLGPAYDIFSYITVDLQLGGKIDLQVKAHWKLMMEIGMDDYHIVAVHPDTFGKKGYLPSSRFDYFEFGAHSLLVMPEKSINLNAMAIACKEQKFSLQKGSFILFQLFPTLTVILTQPFSLFKDDYCYLTTLHFKPQSRYETRLDMRFFLMPFDRPAGFIRRLVRKVAVPFVNVFFKYYMTKVNKEDNQICENIQKVSHQIQGDMRLSVLEKRVAWFGEVYKRYITSKLNKK